MPLLEAGDNDYLIPVMWAARNIADARAKGTIKSDVHMQMMHLVSRIKPFWDLSNYGFG